MHCEAVRSCRGRAQNFCTHMFLAFSLFVELLFSLIICFRFFMFPFPKNELSIHSREIELALSKTRISRFVFKSNIVVRLYLHFFIYLFIPVIIYIFLFFVSYFKNKHLLFFVFYFCVFFILYDCSFFVFILLYKIFHLCSLSLFIILLSRKHILIF